jgi:hypothetical protein
MKNLWGDDVFLALAKIREQGLWDEADLVSKEMLALQAEVVYLRRRIETSIQDRDVFKAEFDT